MLRCGARPVHLLCMRVWQAGRTGLVGIGCADAEIELKACQVQIVHQMASHQNAVLAAGGKCALGGRVLGSAGWSAVSLADMAMQEGRRSGRGAGSADLTARCRCKRTELALFSSNFTALHVLARRMFGVRSVVFDTEGVDDAVSCLQQDDMELRPLQPTQSAQQSRQGSQNTILVAIGKNRDICSGCSSDLRYSGVRRRFRSVTRVPTVLKDASDVVVTRGTG